MTRIREEEEGKVFQHYVNKGLWCVHLWDGTFSGDQSSLQNDLLSSQRVHWIGRQELS